MIKNFALMVM